MSSFVKEKNSHDDPYALSGLRIRAGCDTMQCAIAFTPYISDGMWQVPNLCRITFNWLCNHKGIIRLIKGFI